MAEGDGLVHPPQKALTLADHMRRRLLIGLLITSVTAAASLAAGAFSYLETDRAYGEVLTQASTTQSLISDLNDAVVSEVLHTRAYLITGDEQSVTSQDLARQDFQRAYADLQGRLAPLPEAATFKLQQLMSIHADYDALADKIIALRRSGQAEAAVKLFNEQSDPWVLKLLATRRDLRSVVQAWEFQVDRDYSIHVRQIILVVAFVFVIATIVSGWLVTRLLAPSLSALGYFEHALIETAGEGALTPTPLPRSMPDQRSPVFQAYNALVNRLRESEASRLEFLTRIAHNLRSPLASIIAYAELMSDPALRPPDADLEGFARLIAAQAARLGQMVEQMVTAAHIGEDQLELIQAPVPLGALLAEVVAEARQRRRREIIFEDGLGPIIVPGDALYLRQAFWNLIDNALKFSAPETSVQVTLRRAPTPGWAEVTVADCGIGIAETDLPILFTRFGRIHNERTRSNTGNGLGLYIVKYIVDRHRGKIAVHSQPGQGATFGVTLPFGSGPAQAGGSGHQG